MEGGGGGEMGGCRDSGDGVGGGGHFCGGVEGGLVLGWWVGDFRVGFWFQSCGVLYLGYVPPTFARPNKAYNSGR